MDKGRKMNKRIICGRAHLHPEAERGIDLSRTHHNNIRSCHNYLLCNASITFSFAVGLSALVCVCMLLKTGFMVIKSNLKAKSEMQSSICNNKIVSQSL